MPKILDVLSSLFFQVTFFVGMVVYATLIAYVLKQGSKQFRDFDDYPDDWSKTKINFAKIKGFTLYILALLMFLLPFNLYFFYVQK